MLGGVTAAPCSAADALEQNPTSKLGRTRAVALCFRMPVARTWEKLAVASIQLSAQPLVLFDK